MDVWEGESTVRSHVNMADYAEEVEKHVQVVLVLRPNTFKEKTKVLRVRPKVEINLWRRS